MSFLIKNISTTAVDINDLGITLIPNETYDLSEDPANGVATSVDLPANVTAGWIRVIDPTDNTTVLSIADSLTAIGMSNSPNYGIVGGTLSQLSDTNFTTLSLNDGLLWNGTEWINSPIGTGSGSLQDLPTLQAATSSNVTISTTNTFQDVILDITQYNNDPSTIKQDPTRLDRVIIYETGTYMLEYRIVISNTSSGRIRINDNTIIPGSEITSGYNYNLSSLSDVITCNVKTQLNVGDYVTLQVATPYPTATVYAGATFTVTKLHGIKGDPGPPGPGSSIIVQQNNTDVQNTPHTTLNFTGDVIVSDGGNGIANIAVPQANVFHSHNGNTTQTLSTSFANISFDTVEIQDSYYTYLPTGNTVTINADGVYKITYDMTCEGTTNTRTAATHKLTNNDIDIPGSISYTYHRNVAAGETTATCTVIRKLNTNDSIAVKSRISASANVRTISNGCRITIERLY